MNFSGLVPGILLGFFSLAGASALAQGRLAYMWEKDGQKQIYLADADGKNGQAVTSGPQWHLYPDLDSSGTRVLFVQGSDEKHLGVQLLDLKTAQTLALTGADHIHLHPDFSGDGRWVAFSEQAPGAKAQIKVAELGEDGLRLETQVQVDSDWDCYFPALSHAGDFVIFQRSRARTQKDIVLYNFKTKALTQVTPEQGNAMAPALSADDQDVVYTQRVGENWDLYVQNLRTRVVRRLTFEDSMDFAPNFRPDGSIVFASTREGHFELYEIAANWKDIKTPVARKIVAAEADLYAPSVSVNSEVSLTKAAPIPDPERSSFGAIRVGRFVAVVGGHQGHEHTYPKESFSDQVNLYDLETGEWKTASPRPRPAHGFSLAASGKYLYAFGGFAFSDAHKPGWRSLDEIDRYDTETDRWETIGQLPRRRSSNVVAQIGTKVYLIGGWDGTPKFEKDYDGVFHREIDVFDLLTETASVSPHLLPNPLRRAFTGVVWKDEILLIGGLGEGASHFELLDAVTAFNPETGSFRELPKLPFATFAPGAGILGDRLFVFGGMFKIGKEDYNYVNDIYEHSLGSAGWFHTRIYLSEQKGFSQVVNLGDSLGILGGHTYENDTDHPVKTFEIFRTP